MVPGRRETPPRPDRRRRVARPCSRRGRRVDAWLLAAAALLAASVALPATGAAAAHGPAASTAASVEPALDAPLRQSRTPVGNGSTPAPTESPTASDPATDGQSSPTDRRSTEATTGGTPSPTASPTSVAPRTTSGGAPAFVVRNVTAPDVVRVGDELVASAAVANPAARTRTERVAYSLAGRTVASKRVTLEAGASRRVTFRAGTGSLRPGTYVHGVRNASGDGAALRVRVTPDANLTVRALDAPAAVSRDESYVVVATLANPADAAVTRRVSYEFDGRVVAAKPVTVPAGGAGRAVFEVDPATLAAVAGPLENGSVHTQAVTAPGGARRGGELLVRRVARADPSALAVRRLDAPDDVAPGEDLAVSLAVRNVGRAAFEGQIAYRVDGVALDTAWLRVPVGERRTVTFETSHRALERLGAVSSPGSTTQGVWVDETALAERPLAVRGPFATPTPRLTARPTLRPATRTDARGGAAGTPGREHCSRGLFTECGGGGFDETWLTVLGILTSVAGIVYEMSQN